MTETIFLLLNYFHTVCTCDVYAYKLNIDQAYLHAKFLNILII